MQSHTPIYKTRSTHRVIDGKCQHSKRNLRLLDQLTGIENKL